MTEAGCDLHPGGGVLKTLFSDKFLGHPSLALACRAILGAIFN
ncbi:MAG: hypothetical protein NTX50_27935 [Candidatus Sumerlaeota bacterium]|nr:hypothetical protein [Candidatus Sumerlaeota bacterium]